MKDKKADQKTISKSISNHDSTMSHNNSTSFFQNITGNSNLTSDISQKNNIVEDVNSSTNKSTLKTQYKFISKLVELLDTPDISDVISWNVDGTIIEIKNQRKFVDQILPQHFKHNNFSNFVRQLNMYHFKKVKNYITPGIIAYSNQYFIKGCTNLLSEINRRNQGSTTQVNKELSIFDNDNLKDDALTNKLNFLFNRLFDLENKVSALTNVNDNLLANNLTFMNDLKDKSYYINMLESLIFFIVNNLLSNNVLGNNDNLHKDSNYTNVNEFRNVSSLVCTCEKKYSSNNILKDKAQDDYFNSPDSPNSSTVNLNNFCGQGTLSAFNSFNLGHLNEFIMSSQSFLSNNPRDSFQLISKDEKHDQTNNNLELNDNTSFIENKEIKEIKDNSTNINIVKLNEVKDKLIKSESFKRNFCDKCFLQKKLANTPSGLGSFHYTYKKDNIINTDNSTANKTINNNSSFDYININSVDDKYKVNSENKDEFFKVILSKYKEYNKHEKSANSILSNSNKFPQLPSKHVKLKQDLLPNDPSFDRNVDVNMRIDSPSKNIYNDIPQSLDLICKPQPIKLKKMKAINEIVDTINKGNRLDNSFSSNK